MTNIANLAEHKMLKKGQKTQMKIKRDAALPRGRVWAWKDQEELSKMLFKASEWLLLSNAVRNFIPTFATQEVKPYL